MSHSGSASCDERAIRQCQQRSTTVTRATLGQHISALTASTDSVPKLTSAHPDAAGGEGGRKHRPPSNTGQAYGTWTGLPSWTERLTS